MPRDRQGQAVEPTKSAMHQDCRPWSARVPSWLVDPLAAGVGHAGIVRPDPSTLGVVGERGFRHEQRAAGVEGLRFHDLRHSAAILALAAGANTRELMERMGHTSPAVALRYQHVMAGRDQAITAALDELVQAAATLPPQPPAEGPRGTLVARNRRAKGVGRGRRVARGR
jgi:Phage integrase family